jgi:hypothetical protein
VEDKALNIYPMKIIEEHMISATTCCEKERIKEKQRKNKGKTKENV